MSGGFWAGSVPPWASVILVLVCGLVFVLGLAAGESMGRRHELQDRAEEEEREGEERAEGERPWHGPLPELPPKWSPSATAQFDAIREAGRNAWRIQQERAGRRTSTAAFLDPRVAHEAWLAHSEQAIDLANDERRPDGSPIDTGEIRAITEGMDVFLGRLLAEHPVLYPDGDQ